MIRLPTARAWLFAPILTTLVLNCETPSSSEDEDKAGGTSGYAGATSGTGSGGRATGGSGGSDCVPPDCGGAPGGSDGGTDVGGAGEGGTPEGGDTGGPSGGSGRGGSGGAGPMGGSGAGKAGGGSGGATGGAGKAGAGGSAGSAGTTNDPLAGCTMAAVAPAATLTAIDGFEDNNTYAEGYGAWYNFDDGTASSTLALAASVPPGGGSYSARTTGGVHTGFGSGLGLILHDSSGDQLTFDPSTADGIQFWARTGSAPTWLRVSFPDRNSDPRGGTCSEPAGTCYQYWGVDIPLDARWRLYRVRFDELYTRDPAHERPFDRAGLYRMEMQIDPGVSYDFSVDGAALFRYATNAYAVAGKDFEKNHAARVFRGVNRPSLEWDAHGQYLSRADFALMRSWGADTVRIPLNQGFWLSGSVAYDPTYAATVDKVIACAHQADLDVIIDLHWSDRGNLATVPAQQKMADINSDTFWHQVAARYKNNSRILFELYNEPHDVSWPVWRNGGSAVEFNAVGFQNLYDAVRDEGAENVVIAGGLNYAYDLSGLPGYKLSGYNVGYATHVYNFLGKQPADWPGDWGFLAGSFPLIATEFGDTTSCSGNFSQSFLDYATPRNVSWTAWAWWVEATNPCGFPTLVSDWNGTPTTAGSVVRTALGL